jgi:uncharacterized RDD family membrane protein YckC
MSIQTPPPPPPPGGSALPPPPPGWEATNWGPHPRWNPPGQDTSKVDVLGRPYADWGTRAVGHLIDIVVVLCGWGVLIAVAVAGSNLRTAPDQSGNTNISALGGLVVAVSLIGLVVLTLAYHLLNGGKSGQTLGKRVVHIQVRDAETGGPISYPRAFGRYLGSVVAWLILPFLVFVDLLWPLWDDRRQTVHDKAVNSVVIQTGRHPTTTTQPRDPWRSSPG